MSGIRPTAAQVRVMLSARCAWDRHSCWSSSSG